MVEKTNIKEMETKVKASTSYLSQESNQTNQFPANRKQVHPDHSKARPEIVAAEDLKHEDFFDPYEIIKTPLSTEKGIRQIEFDNKLIFIVHPQATKADVKKAVEELFKVTVVKVNIQNSFTGQKKAYVKLSAKDLASDVSANLGLI